MAIMLPPELETPFSMLGVPWPTENEDGLHECATAYRACAAAITTSVTPLAHHGAQQAKTGNLGAGADAFADFWTDYHDPGDGSGHLSELDGTLNLLADAHDGAADLVRALKLVLLTLAAILLSVLVKILVVAMVNAGAAALQARTLMTALRAAARRFVSIFYRDFVKIFGETIIRSARAALHRVLGARPAERTVARVYADTRYVGRSEETMLAGLRGARENHLSPLGGGSTEVFLVELPDGMRVVYKPIPEFSHRVSIPESGMPFRELEAYRFSERLGWDLVPPTAVGNGPRGIGSVQMHVGNARSGWRDWTEIERQRASAFDYAIGNLDRTPGNFLTDDDGALKLIDHALTSPTSSEAAIRSPFVMSRMETPFDPGVLADLRKLDLEEEARRMRASGLGIVETGGRIERLKELQDHGMITGKAWRGRINYGTGS
ncbi:WXG100-like domain-containing protein [Streptosporangium subroseum]|uniref:WXG100-like domain-containing protein n=1 Tax=Streptosporangium subroseum TaxID=106412 RepID=UPI003086F51D|nr:hypothetical protein OHB15_00920 [Streptosporangium subroseum]